MKTKLCKPVLIESKDKDSLIYCNSLIGKISYGELSPVHCTHYQLILISLDSDEKIEENDSWVGHKIGEIEEDSKLILVTPENRKSILYHVVKSKFGKVIATQSHLSSELINRLVAEYNNGGMKNFEIEIVSINEQRHIDNPDFISNVLDCESRLKMIPKLTNGFVTIVEKDNSDREIIDYAFKRQTIFYTEEEVLKLLKRYGKQCNCLSAHIHNQYDNEKEGKIEFTHQLTEWFKQNKKK